MPDATGPEEVAAEIAALRDLFQRRLLDDKVKARLFDELHGHLEFARDGLARGVLRPLLSELLLLKDRLQDVAENDAVDSAVEELEEVLRRRGVRVIPADEHFDPRYHEAVRVDLSATEPKGRIVTVLREGYLLGDEVLRPALVVVSSGEASSLSASQGRQDE